MLIRRFSPFLKTGYQVAKRVESFTIVSRSCSFAPEDPNYRRGKKPLVTKDDLLDPIGNRETEHFTFDHKERILLNEVILPGYGFL